MNGGQKHTLSTTSNPKGHASNHEIKHQFESMFSWSHFFRSDTGPKEAIVVIQLGRGATVAPLAARSVTGSTGFVVSLGGLFDQQQKDVMEASSFAAQG